MASVYLAMAQSNKFNTRISSTSLTNATENIISTFYATRTSSIFISRSSNSTQGYIRQSEIINYILMKIESKISYSINEGQGLSLGVHLRFFNVFFVDNYSGFRYGAYGVSVINRAVLIDLSNTYLLKWS